MFIKIKKIKIHIICLFLILLFILINFSIYILILFFCILIHEIGHIIFIKANKFNILSIEILPFGINISTDNKLAPYKTDVMIALSGPFMNLISALVIFIIIRLNGYVSILFFAMLTNIIYAVINLFPVKSLDGGKAVNNILKIVLPEHPARIISEVISAVFLGILSLFAFFVLMITEYNFTLILLCCYLFYNIHFAPVNVNSANSNTV